LLRANEEFVEEVERLYQEEERWEEEAAAVRAEGAELGQRLGDQLEEARGEAERERERHGGEEERLVESVRVLTIDTDRLREEREREKVQNSRSHDELREEWEDEVTRLRATVSCLRAELEQETAGREEAEAEAERAAGEAEAAEGRAEAARQEARQVRAGLETKLGQLEKRGERLAAENFELTVEKDELGRKVGAAQESARKAEREAGQARVEREWLVSQQRGQAGSSERAGELAEQLEKATTELREEKTKVWS
jgi:hypothetical protein